MNSNTLFVLLFILLSACSPKQNTDFILEDYLGNIQVLEEDNKLMRENIEDAIDVRPERNRIHKENIGLFYSNLNPLLSEIDSLIKNEKSVLTKSKLNRIYDSSLGLANLINEKHREKLSDEYRAENAGKIFAVISNFTFWNELISESNENTVKIALAKLYYELMKCENKLLRFYDTFLNRRVISCPGPLAKVIAPSSYIMCGAFYEAEIHLFSHGHYNNSDLVRIVVNNKEIPIVGGYGVYKVKAPNYAGIHKVEGYVVLNTPEGLVKEQFRSEWQSFLPAISFEFDEYQKVKSNEETEFAIQVPGFRQEDLIVESSKGKLTKQRGIGKYKILVDEKPNTQFQIKVSVKMPDGSIRKMGERKMECTQ